MAEDNDTEMDELTSSAMLQAQPKKKHRQLLDVLPLEVIDEIMDLLGPVGRICLGLTCHGMYACMKHLHRGPIELSCQGWLPSNEVTTIGKAISSWKGFKGYRLSARPIHIFLNMHVYGRHPGSKENALRSRVLDFHESSGSSRWRDQILQNLNPASVQLPDPHNMGNSWYTAAFTVIERSLNAMGGHLESWRSWWSDMEIFSEHQDHWGRFVTRIETQDVSLLADVFGAPGSLGNILSLLVKSQNA